jgi:hypothetical protein
MALTDPPYRSSPLYVNLIGSGPGQSLLLYSVLKNSFIDPRHSDFIC